MQCLCSGCAVLRACFVNHSSIRFPSHPIHVQYCVDVCASQNITFSAISDNIPELPEQFIFTLTMVEVLNEAASRTPTSGASLNVARAQASVVISSNDSPYGIFQFSTSIPPSGVAFIPVSSTAPSIQLRESAGLVDIYVVRAQGTVGNATVEYTTSPGTAVGDGASPDYMPAVGTLDFAAGQLSRSFQIRINDDSTPELAKFFTLNLTNPQGGKRGDQFGSVCSETYCILLHTIKTVVIIVSSCHAFSLASLCWCCMSVSEI